MARIPLFDFCALHPKKGIGSSEVTKRHQKDSQTPQQAVDSTVGTEKGGASATELPVMAASALLLPMATYRKGCKAVGVFPC